MELKRNVALDIVLTLLLCGLWNVVVQNHQCKALNALLGEEKFVMWKVYLFTLLTCGLYFIYFEWSKADEFMKWEARTNPNKADSSDAVLAVVLTFVGLHFIYDGILQSKINDQTLLPPSSSTPPPL